MPVDVTPALSPARQALADAIAAVAAANAEVERATAPLRRLEGLLSEQGQLEARLAGYREEHDRAVGAWRAGGCAGERPRPDPRSLGVEQRLDEIGRDVPGVRSVHAEHQEAQRAAQAKLVAAVAHRQRCIYACLRDAARPAFAALRAAIARAVTVEATTLAGLVAVLQQRVAQGDTEPGGELEWLINEIKAVRGSIAVPRDEDRARRLLDRLATDPTAELTPSI